MSFGSKLTRILQKKQMHPLYGSFGPGTKENVVLLTVLNAVTQTRYCHYPALAVLLMEVTANVIVVWSYIYIYIYITLSCFVSPRKKP